MFLEDAVDQAIDTCIEQGILTDILSKSKIEVRNMLLTEYDEKAETAGIRLYGGFEEGLEGPRISEKIIERIKYPVRN